MKRDGVLTYLVPDHLGGTVATLNLAGQVEATQQYYAYCRQRGGTGVATDHQCTGQT